MAQLGRQIIKHLMKNSISIRNHTPIISTSILNENPCQLPKYDQIRRYSGAYEGDGKTTMTLLNQEKELGLMINSYSQMGFRLNNNVFVLGPMAIFPRTVMAWNVDTCDDINEQSLRLVSLLEPKIDVLILGIGDANPNPAFTKRILQFMNKYKITVEILRTEAACATFNFLNAESRMVAALLIPPLHLNINEDDLMRHTIKRNLYQLEEDDMFGSDSLKKIK